MLNRLMQNFGNQNEIGFYVNPKTLEVSKMTRKDLENLFYSDYYKGWINSHEEVENLIKGTLDKLHSTFDEAKKEKDRLENELLTNYFESISEGNVPDMSELRGLILNGNVRKERVKDALEKYVIKEVILPKAYDGAMLFYKPLKVRYWTGRIIEAKECHSLTHDLTPDLQVPLARAIANGYLPSPIIEDFKIIGGMEDLGDLLEYYYNPNLLNEIIERDFKPFTDLLK